MFHGGRRGSIPPTGDEWSPHLQEAVRRDSLSNSNHGSEAELSSDSRRGTIKQPLSVITEKVEKAAAVPGSLAVPPEPPMKAASSQDFSGSDRMRSKSASRTAMVAEEKRSKSADRDTTSSGPSPLKSLFTSVDDIATSLTLPGEVSPDIDLLAARFNSPKAPPLNFESFDDESSIKNLHVSNFEFFHFQLRVCYSNHYVDRVSIG
jgi:hypothetical protein